MTPKYLDEFHLIEIDPQARIHEWAEMTFGSVTLFRPLFDRVMAEVKELDDEIDLLPYDESLVSVQADPKLMHRIKGECADVVITLFRLAGSLGFDLLAEVDRKQTVNEGRKWRSHGDGTGQHIKNTEA